MNTFEIEIDSYTFYVSVTDYVNVPAQGKWASSDVDCYGYTEIDWDVTSVTYCDEDGNETEVQVDIAEYSELIEEKLLEEIRDMRDDDFDYDDDGYDGY